MTEILIIAVVILGILNVYNDWRIRDTKKNSELLSDRTIGRFDELYKYFNLERTGYFFIDNHVLEKEFEKSVARNESVEQINKTLSLLLSHLKLKIETRPEIPSHLVIKKITKKL
jgi:hypothetical protein